MTEVEAYKALGWPTEGNCPNGFILPIQENDLRVDWLVYRCSECTFRGLSVPEALALHCVGCGKSNIMLNEGGQDLFRMAP
jgi:hypothetical protein